MACAPGPIEGFAGSLAQSESSPLTIKKNRGDLTAFAAWFGEFDGEETGRVEDIKTARVETGRNTGKSAGIQS